MRERERLEQVKQFKKTVVLVQFPDRIQLQGTFWANENNTDLYTFVKNSLADPNVPFYLYVTPPVQRLPVDIITFRKQMFVPAVLVHFGREKGAKVTGNFLKEELLKDLKEKLPPKPFVYTSIFDDQSTGIEIGKPDLEQAPPKKENKPEDFVPRWFQLGNKKKR